MLDLAILGLLKEQPLHGYELKKRLGETLGFLWGVSYGSLYPALQRLESGGAIEVVAPPATARPPMPPTGSVAGEAAVAKVRRMPKPSRRNRKAYRITARGHVHFDELLADDQQAAGDEERTFALKLAFCRHASPPARLDLLERRRTELTNQLGRARHARLTRVDRYARSVVKHRSESIERDLEWVDELIAAERQQLPEQEGATA